MRLFFIVLFGTFFVSAGIFIFLINIGLSRELSAESAVQEDFYQKHRSGRVLGVSEVNYDLGLPMFPDKTDEQVVGDKILQTIPFEFASSSPLEIGAKKAIAIDALSNKILFAKNADEQTPIASISKLVTALTFLQHNPGWETIYEIKKEDRREGGRIYLYTGEKVRVRDLFHLSLTASANTATMAMVHSTGLSEREFVREMNKLTKKMGLEQSSFNEPVGLSRFNYSTAREVVQILKEALKHKEIKEALLAPQYSFYTLDKRYKIAYNTDRLLNEKNKNLKMLGGKTGYTEMAGYCFTGAFENNKNNKIFVAILDDDTHYSRFSDAKKLAEWVYEGFLW